MEINLISKDKKFVVIEFTDVKETIVHPLVDKLHEDKDVLLAAYKTGHPQLDHPKLTIKTKKVAPETAVKNATESLEKEIIDLKKEFEKALRGTKTQKGTPTKKKAEKPTKTEPKTSKAKSKKPSDTKKKTKKK